MIFDLLDPPQGPWGGGGGGGGEPKQCAAVRHTHVSNSHTKFGWIWSNGSGGNSRKDGQTDGRTEVINIPIAF